MEGQQERRNLKVFRYFSFLISRSERNEGYPHGYMYYLLVKQLLHSAVESSFYMLPIVLSLNFPLSLVL